MKLADKIADLIESKMQDNMATYNDAYIAEDTIAEIIAKELRPIRDTLEMTWDNPEEMRATDILTQYSEAVELLKEVKNED